MSELALQLITVELENGKQGVFIGGPLITDDYTEEETQVDSIWFSEIQEVSDNITLAELLNFVTKEIRSRNNQLN
ncbi:MAG: hypothetical protein OEZ39_07255 [Gammaproteobacteria bacterium]|nr:hypothetical protein [Gammaproteobacteria bacterium]MDH5651655.1 hypothetical protein [Gammaproteobacteria bacterium]